MHKESTLMILGYRKTVHKWRETLRERDRASAQQVQEQVPKGWPKEQNEPEERKQGAAQLAVKHSQSEAGCPGWRGLFGERICSQSKFAIYNRGTVICWLEPSKKSSSETYGSRDFPGIGQLVLSSKLSGGQREKTPSFPLIVPGRLFSVSNIGLQVEKLKWIWREPFTLGHLNPGIVLVEQSPSRRSHCSTRWGRRPRREAGTRCKGASLTCGAPAEVPASRQHKTRLSYLYSSSLLVRHNVRLFKGPPCSKISFICVYKTVYTDAHTITL